MATIATAAFIFSVSSLFVKILEQKERVPPGEIILVQGLCCWCSTSVLLILEEKSVHSKTWRVAFLTLLRGFLGAMSLACLYTSFQLLPLQDAVTLFFCSPVIAAVLELAVTRRWSGWASVAASLCTVGGVVLVAQSSVGGGGHVPHSVEHVVPTGGAGAAGGASSSSSSVGGGGGAAVDVVGDLASSGGNSTAVASEAAAAAASESLSAVGVLLATAAATCSAAAFVIVRQISCAQTALGLTWWYHSLVVLVAALAVGLRYPSPAVLPATTGTCMLLTVGVLQFLGQLLLNRGFQLISATRGAAVNVLQVPFSFMWGVVILGNRPALVSLAGALLIVAGVLVVAFQGNKNAASAKASSGTKEEREALAAGTTSSSSCCGDGAGDAGSGSSSSSAAGGSSGPTPSPSSSALGTYTPQMSECASAVLYMHPHPDLPYPAWARAGASLRLPASVSAAAAASIGPDSATATAASAANADASQSPQLLLSDELACCYNCGAADSAACACRSSAGLDGHTCDGDSNRLAAAGASLSPPACAEGDEEESASLLAAGYKHPTAWGGNCVGNSSSAGPGSPMARHAVALEAPRLPAGVPSHPAHHHTH
ncbi:hypothetical protein HYH02_008378 [Chlamydomonas schloesseri]|uniref:EamA domain-containing protein n=1 Tax=Chlamydomonas schloesseri TaxID=2026947 RepID=A0A835WG23_9CHLO|nr:hypothetical protein HYH02_008378 [Chlamydomonas schloesseri]|eukprot:KAG2446818.1 hypothetical protein HYH02_008378 [Chlamydomonas schloesseri]